jgi:nucleobase:cation symporter-1, NCS1 family
VEAPALWQVEERGLEPVPSNARHGTTRSILWTWLAANIGVLGVTLGSGLVTGLGLNFWQTLLVAAVGSVGSFAFVALVSLAGPFSGAPTMVASRATFGIRGNAAPAAISWIVLAGLEIVMCTMATFALANIVEIVGFPVGPWLTIPVALFLVAGAAAISYFGHSLIMLVQQWLGWVLGGLTAVLCVLALVTVDWPIALAAPGGDFVSILAGIGVIAAGTGVSWMSAGADYTRYLPEVTSEKRLFGVTLLGSGAPLVLLIATGSLLALGNSETVGLALPDWLLIPYLVVAVLGLLTAADLAMYSSGLSLQATGVPLSRPKTLLISAAVVAVGTVTIVTVRSVSGDDVSSQAFSALIALFALPLVAWVGVFGLDLLLRRNLFDDDLTDTSPDSAYWFHNGFHWPAIGAWLAGSVFGLLCTSVRVGDATWFAGPLAETWLGRNSLGWLVAGIGASAVYWVVEPLTRGEHSPGRAHPDE